MSLNRRWVLPIAAGVVVTIGATGLLIGLLGLSPLLALPLGVVLGAGMGLTLSPDLPRKIEITSTDPDDVPMALMAVKESCHRMDSTMRKLRSSPLWQGTDTDERLMGLIHAVYNLTSLPQLANRQRVDGDVHMLYLMGTEYLPQIVNLVVENDRMHSTFSGSSSRARVEDNVRNLGTQVAVLSEGVDHIETSIVRGSTQSVHEHAAFLELRFRESGAKSVLDLEAPLEK